MNSTFCDICGCLGHFYTECQLWTPPSSTTSTSSLEHMYTSSTFNPWPQYDPCSYTYEPNWGNYSYFHQNNPQPNFEGPQKSNLEALLENFIVAQTKCNEENNETTMQLTSMENYPCFYENILQTNFEDPHKSDLETLLENFIVAQSKQNEEFKQQGMIINAIENAIKQLTSAVDSLAAHTGSLEKQIEQLPIAHIGPMEELEGTQYQKDELKELNFDNDNTNAHVFDFKEKHEPIVGVLDKNAKESYITQIGGDSLDVFMMVDDNHEETEQQLDPAPIMNTYEVKLKTLYHTEFEVIETPEPRYEPLNPNFDLSITIYINLNDAQMILLLNNYKKIIGYPLYR